MCIIHKWSRWSRQVPTYNGVYQYSFCKKCNKVKSYRRMGYNGSSNTSNLSVWNNPTSEADNHLKERIKC